MLAADDLVVWKPPEEEVDVYEARIFYYNRRNKVAGRQNANIAGNTSWLVVTEKFEPIQGVQYYVQVRS